MHDYFKKEIEVRKARRGFKSTIEDIANECNIDINIKVSLGIPTVTVWDKSAEVMIDARGVLELVHTRPDIPIDKGWDIFLPKLRQLV